MDLEKLKQWHQNLRKSRTQHNAIWEEVATYVRPTSRSQTTVDTSSQIDANVYDSTPARACHELASALLGMVFNPETKWAKWEAPPNTQGRPQEPGKIAKEWLDKASAYTLHYLLDPEVNFYSSLHECLLDYCAFGEGMLYSEVDPATGKLRFSSVNVQSCSVQLNARRQVDAVFREVYMSAHQVIEQFGAENVPKSLFKQAKHQQTAEQQYLVVHAVFERKHGHVGEINTKKPWASVWYLDTTEVVGFKPREALLKESGYDYFPYVLPRFQLHANEIRGRGPGVAALPAIRTLNAMVQLHLRAAQKQVAPALLMPSGTLLNDLDVSPDAVNFYDPMFAEDLEPKKLGIDGNVQVSELIIQQQRQDIERMFFVDKLSAMQKAAEVKEVEFLGDEESRMRAMIPQLVRLYAEAAVPVLRTTLRFLESKNILEERPPELQEMKLRISSPLSRAQKMQGATMVIRTLSNLLFPIAQVDPNVLGILRTEALGPWMVDEVGLPQEILRSPDEMQARMQQQQQQQAQAQQNAQLLEGSETAKNFAAAAKDGGLRGF